MLCLISHLYRTYVLSRPVNLQLIAPLLTYSIVPLPFVIGWFCFYEMRFHSFSSARPVLVSLQLFCPIQELSSAALCRS